MDTKITLSLILNEEEMQELYGIIVDRDQAGALTYLERHLYARLRRAMEGS